MNLRGIDLNLLVVLQALLDEAHVTRAAERLGLSQPAMSNALERCRHLFGDPLLERAKGGMRLTPKAEALREPLARLLADAARVIDPHPQVDLATLRQTVRIVMADYPAVVVVGPLQARLAASAPGIALVVEPWHGAADALDAMARGRLDLAVSVFPAVEASFHREELLHEQYAVCMRAGHPAAKDFNLERWLQYPHVLVSGRGETRGALDQALLALQRTRRVGVVVPSFLLVPPLLASSDLIAMVPRRCLRPVAGGVGVGGESSSPFGGLAVFEPPIAVEGFALHLAWHARRQQDAGVRFVAGVVGELLRG
ncbi:LysR family transcriptional regulator [Acidovorax sp.]|uniref:LysR family transcriptional regulator n=1 Tax=Acidovorax sp. TaxID=1872122 RepID=UPI002ACDAF9E|nr:LysR substrate-binding domain-containing protein [Acidovorax sp.]MDZ7865248.1 LysR substrate-binding domain-containing protein [Acidovorax sp.]